jgi:hypothetical protein
MIRQSGDQLLQFRVIESAVTPLAHMSTITHFADLCQRKMPVLKPIKPQSRATANIDEPFSGGFRA